MNFDEISAFIMRRADEEKMAAIAACVEFVAENWTADANAVDCIHPRNRATVVDVGGAANKFVAEHIAMHDPAQIWLEWAAKKHIVKLAMETSEPQALEVMGEVLRTLAGIYHDHPEFQWDEWNV